MLVASLTSSVTPAGGLLVAAMQVWLTNVIRFSQDENDDSVTEVAAGSSRESGWIPIFADYRYVSLTNSSAFSPTDTMP